MCFSVVSPASFENVKEKVRSRVCVVFITMRKLLIERPCLISGNTVYGGVINVVKAMIWSISSLIRLFSCIVGA